MLKGSLLESYLGWMITFWLQATCCWRDQCSYRLLINSGFLQNAILSSFDLSSCISDIPHSDWLIPSKYAGYIPLECVWSSHSDVEFQLGLNLVVFFILKLSGHISTPFTKPQQLKFYVWRLRSFLTSRFLMKRFVFCCIFSCILYCPPVVFRGHL